MRNGDEVGERLLFYLLFQVAWILKKSVFLVFWLKYIKQYRTISFLLPAHKCFPYHKCHCFLLAGGEWLPESGFPFCSAQTGGTSTAFSFCMNGFQKAVLDIKYPILGIEHRILDSKMGQISVNFNKKVFVRRGEPMPSSLKMII